MIQLNDRVLCSDGNRGTVVRIVENSHPPMQMWPIYTEYIVEYDTPLPGEWPYQSRLVRRGGYRIERLRRLS